jgi:hypothetical protein
MLPFAKTVSTVADWVDFGNHRLAKRGVISHIVKNRTSGDGL